MVQKIKGLNLKVVDQRYDGDIMNILKRLTTLTVTEHDDEFDVVSDGIGDENEDDEVMSVATDTEEFVGGRF